MNARNVMTKVLPLIIIMAAGLSTFHVAKEMFKYDGPGAYPLGFLLGVGNVAAAYWFLEAAHTRTVSGPILIGVVVASSWLQIRFYQDAGAPFPDAYILGTWAPLLELGFGALVAKLDTAEEHKPKRSSGQSLFGALNSAMVHRIQATVEPKPESKPARIEAQPEPELKQAKSEPKSKPNSSSKEDALGKLIWFYSQNPNADQKDAAEFVGRSPGTVSGYMSELEAAGRIHRNGNGVEVLNGG